MEREVHCNDAVEWMKSYEMLPGDVFTSIPDITELDFQIGKYNTSEYKAWFEICLNLIFRKTPGYAIFLQTDARVINQKNQVVEFMDKSFMISKAAEANDFVLLWHKICSHVLKPEEKRCSHKPVWSHLLCYSRRGQHEYPVNMWATPDVFPRGEVVWSRGIGMHSAVTGVSFLKHIAHSEVVVDPFCGHGTVLAMANAAGIRSVGCELSSKRCRRASALDVMPALKQMGWKQRRHYGLTCDLVDQEVERTVEGDAEDVSSDTRECNVYLDYAEIDRTDLTT